MHMDNSMESAKAFWESAAADNAMWYVSSFINYDNPDENSFWKSGADIWDNIKRTIDYCPERSHRVLEIGCGVGRLTRAISEEVGTVHALDISSGMIERAKSLRLRNVTFAVSNGKELPLPAESENLVLAYCVFQHLTSHSALRSYILEMWRVIKPGGLIAFTLPREQWSDGLLPLMRVRRYFVELFSARGPKGLYRKGWTGIRPSVRQVTAITPVPFATSTLRGDTVIYHCRKVERQQGSPDIRSRATA